MSQSAVYDALIDAVGEDQAKALWKWLTVDLRGWGRDGWGRLDQARRDACGGN